MKNKSNVKYILGIVISIIVSSIISVTAAGTLFDSNEVVYDNSNSGLNSSTVKGAIDELYAAATNYTQLDNRLSTIENGLTITSFSATANQGTLTQNSCYKVGSVCTCSFHISNLNSTNFAAGSEKQILTIPDQYKPAYAVYFSYGYVGNGVSNSHYGYLTVNGKIILQHSNGDITDVLMNVTWFV